ncbi:TPA: transglutaminase, partial [Streptococcus pyogenes]|nr:transglutaminase [Streptococcus pyogenes]
NIVTIHGVNSYVDATWNDSAYTTRYFLAGKDVRNTEYRLDSQYNHLANAILNTSYQKG